MIRIATIYCIILLPILTLAQLSGKVIAVSDGDSFTMLIQNNIQIRVRLHGIDAPEYKQPFGQVSRKFLSDQIFGKIIWVKDNGQDRYERTIGIVYTNKSMEGLSVNELSLQAGLSWHYKYYDKNPNWAKLESEARKEKKGLWSEKNPIPPWEWRRL